MNTIDRARAYVAKIPPACSGNGGHNRTFHVACILVHGFALNDGDAMSVLLEYNQRCQPPWKESELRHKLKEAIKSRSSKPVGYLSDKSRLSFVCGMVRPALKDAEQASISLDWLSSSQMASATETAPQGLNSKAVDEVEYDEETGYPIIDGVIIPF